MKSPVSFVKKGTKINIGRVGPPFDRQTGTNKRLSIRYTPHGNNLNVIHEEHSPKSLKDKNTKTIKKAIGKQIKVLFEEAKRGSLPEPVASENTGACPVTQEDFNRQFMNKWILDLQPELLEDFRFSRAKGITF